MGLVMVFAHVPNNEMKRMKNRKGNCKIELTIERGTSMSIGKQNCASRSIQCMRKLNIFALRRVTNG